MTESPDRSNPSRRAVRDARVRRLHSEGGPAGERPGPRAPRRDDGRSNNRPAPPAGRRKKERDPSLPPWPRRRRRSAAAGGEPPRDPFDPTRRLTVLQTTRAPQYLVIGHICADLQPDGSVVLGGTALYSALTAARLGWRVGVLTRGVFGKRIAGMDVPSLEEFADEISIVCQEAEKPTTFINVYTAGRREQTMPHWAGPIDLRGLPAHWRNARVIHLGPIAQEIDQKQTGGLSPQFLGITPQGWMRDWPRETGGKVRLIHLRIAPELLARTDGVIVSVEEIALSRDVVEQVGARRLGVITKGESGARIIYGGETVDLPGFNVPTVDLTGAGDVFAAAFFMRAADRNVSAVNAGRFANAVAALSLRGVGPAGVPTLREVEDLLAAADERLVRR